eukprot:scaffold46195_cov42-Phaeocystis_antarctica.AAC.2
MRGAAQARSSASLAAWAASSGTGGRHPNPNPNPNPNQAVARGGRPFDRVASPALTVGSISTLHGSPLEVLVSAHCMSASSIRPMKDVPG